MNYRLVRHAPAWKLAVLHHVAALLGVLIHVEGVPFGSSGAYRATLRAESGRP